MSRRTRPHALLLTAALLVGACGGTDEPSADEKAVTAAARGVITDAGQACALLTPRALESIYTGGSDPMRTCLRTVKQESLPKSTKLSVVSLEGSRASVGYFTSAGVTGAMELVKQNGAWRMDGATTVAPAG